MSTVLISPSAIADKPTVLKNSQNGRFINLGPDKLRGGYYTTKGIAKWLCDWGVKSPSDRFLEPSCGDGVFLECLVEQLLSIGAKPREIVNQVHGVEIIPEEAEKASVRVRKLVGKNMPCVDCDDFFELWDMLREQAFDCILGNPPFIRFQSFPEPSRSKAMKIMQSAGLKPNKLTNIWVPFVVAAIECLRPGGRIGMVLPAELLQVSYASQLRSYLADRFRRIDIVACNDLFFEDAEQEVVLFLADGALPTRRVENTCRISLTAIDRCKEIISSKPRSVLAKGIPKEVCHDSEKWLKYFLSPTEISFMRALRESSSVVPLSVHATVDVGVVTGKNDFFVLSAEQIDKHGLNNYVVPLVGRSAQLQGAKLTTGDWQGLAVKGEKVHLFYVDPNHNRSIAAGVRKYVQLGEDVEIHNGYKCSIRKPWYSVPSVWNPDCFFFRQIYDFPRVVLNQANATSTDTIHRMTCKSSPKAVAANIYTYLTAASAEIEGRSYGGGVLELEPSEAERLLMPAKLQGSLSIDECDHLIRDKRLDEVLAHNSQAILRANIGLTSRECQILCQIWEKMRDRRMSRRKNMT